MKKNIKSRKNKNNKKGRKSYRKRGGCGCGSKMMSGGNGYQNMQAVGQVPYSYNNNVSTYPSTSNYAGGNNANMYQSGMGNSISGGTRYRKRKSKNNKRRTMKGGWSNPIVNMMDPFMASTGTPMSSVFYTPSNYVPPAPMA